MDKPTLYLVIGAVASICSILFGYIGYSNGKKKERSDREKEIKTESKDDGKTNGALMSDIGYIKSGIDDLKRKQERSEEKLTGLIERVRGVEESAKQAHKRLDRLEKVGDEG